MSSHWKRHQRCHSGYVKMNRKERPTKQRGGVWWLSPGHLKKGSRRGGRWVWQTRSVADLNFISLQREKLAYLNRDREGVRTKKDFTHPRMPWPELFNLDVRSFSQRFPNLWRDYGVLKFSGWVFSFRKQPLRNRGPELEAKAIQSHNFSKIANSSTWNDQYDIEKNASLVSAPILIFLEFFFCKVS